MSITRPPQQGGQDRHPDDQHPPPVKPGAEPEGGGNEQQVAVIQPALGLNKRLPEDEQPDIDKPAHQADHRLPARQESEVQNNQQAKQDSAPVFAQKISELPHGMNQTHP